MLEFSFPQYIIQFQNRDDVTSKQDGGNDERDMDCVFFAYFFSFSIFL